MGSGRSGGRPNQRRRTRKSLLESAARMMADGRRPSLEEIAEAALVSRATAYRYFPNVEALLLEAALDVTVPDADELLDGAPANDAVARLERVEAGLHRMIREQEIPLRTMLAHTLQQGADAAQGPALPRRQNRRLPLIDAALAPVAREFTPSGLDRLRKALAIIIGVESLIVCKDVLQLDDAEAERVRRWAIRALVQAARRQPRAR